MLSERSGVSLPTIKRLEPGDGFLAATHQTVMALERALEAAGVEFTNGDRPGVRLRDRGEAPVAAAGSASKRASGRPAKRPRGK